MAGSCSVSADLDEGTPTAAALSEFLKKSLHAHDIPFTVAPYSALAQVQRIVPEL